MNNAFDFGKEVELMSQKPPIGKDSSIVIWGGAFDEQEFANFMPTFSFVTEPYVIQEHTHKMDFRISNIGGIAHKNPALLERLEAFNKTGNLSLRRNGSRFLWHFIGDDGPARQETLSKLEAAALEVKDFWLANAECRFYMRDESALLWGEYDADSKRWHDDRVGWANLDYPVGDGLKHSKKRVQIDFTVFTENGQTAFVWWKELNQHG